MSRFDEADKRASAAVDRVFGSGATVRLVPMRPPSGSSYTEGGASRQDPSRSVLSGLVGVLTLRPTTSRSDGERQGGNFVGMFATAEAVMSFDRSQFPTGHLPRRGDRIELSHPVEGFQFFEAGRPESDGSARIVVPLVAVRS